MELNNFTSFINFLGIAQGLVMGIVLIASYKKKGKAMLFLGIFLIVYALNLLQEPLHHFGFFSNYPEYLLMPIYFYWSIFVFFYLYVVHISSLPKSKSMYLLLIPGAIEFIAGLIIFFQSVDVKWEIYQSYTYLYVVIYGSIVYSCVLAIVMIFQINKHIKKIGDFFSSLEKKDLQWAKLYGMTGIILMLTNIILPYEIMEMDLFHFIYALINVGLLYWITIRGFHQKSILVPSIKYTLEKEQTPPEQKVNPVKYNQLIDEATQLIETRNFYTKPDLTIIDLANELDVHPKLISQSINTVLGQNFNTYINSFRIEKAKVMLKNSKKDLSIDGIGFEVGFKSKSSFYSAFKKFTNTTPSKF